MNLGEITQSFRNQIGEQSVRRFTTSIVTDYANRAQKQIAFQVDFPEASFLIATIANQREYQLPELIKIMRVFMEGPDGSRQELLASDRYLLNGEIQGQYDNSSGLIQTQPIQSSNFFAQQPLAYPVQNVGLSGRGSGPIPTKLAWGPNSRPTYYLNGGYIGVVPAPIGVYNIRVEYIPVPRTLNLSSDVSSFPDIFLDAVVWQMIGYARMSDNTSAYKDAMMMFQDQISMKIQPWLEHIQATKPKTLVPRTTRMTFRSRRGYTL